MTRSCPPPPYLRALGAISAVIPGFLLSAAAAFAEPEVKEPPTRSPAVPGASAPPPDNDTPITTSVAKQDGPIIVTATRSALPPFSVPYTTESVDEQELLERNYRS